MYRYSFKFCISHQFLSSKFPYCILHFASLHRTQANSKKYKLDYSEQQLKSIWDAASGARTQAGRHSGQAQNDSVPPSLAVSRTLHGLPLAVAVSPSAWAMRCMAVAPTQSGMLIFCPKTEVDRSITDTSLSTRGYSFHLAQTRRRKSRRHQGYLQFLTARRRFSCCEEKHGVLGLEQNFIAWHRAAVRPSKQAKPGGNKIHGGQKQQKAFEHYWLV